MAMAFTAPTYPPTQGLNVRQVEVTALDADVAGAWTHGLPFIPEFCLLEPRDAAFSLVVAGTSVGWHITGITATQVAFAKTNGAGSGGAVPGTTVLFVAHAGRWIDGVKGS